MRTFRIEILTGEQAGTVVELDSDRVRIGSARSADVALAAPLVSEHHALLVVGGEGATLHDTASAHGTAIVRDGATLAVDPTREGGVPLLAGDEIVLAGGPPSGARLRVQVAPIEDRTAVLGFTPLGELTAAPRGSDRAGELLRVIGSVQRDIALAEGLDGVVAAVASAALELVPRATHATVVLRAEPSDGGGPGDWVPVVTRVRSADGRAHPPDAAVRLTRSVVRRVVRERGAVLAADAAGEGLETESLLGASIRSTIGVPLWRGEDILGVLQVDNRDAPAMFGDVEVEVLGVLAAHASLAVANARLIQGLQAAELRLERENAFLKQRERARTGGAEIVGTSAAMRALLSQIDRVVDTRVTVLVEGETGTGKELVASAIHHRSRRRGKLFVAQNCAALPDNLLESELFGHRRGAFTGATEDKKGLFEVADGGTLFLDEVTEMPLALQAKLLRVLQEGEIRPLGATAARTVDVRIVAACNRELEGEVRAGRFREDLFYRLRVFPLRVPPLRERTEDVPLLAAHFLARYSREFGKGVGGFAQQTLELLRAYEWPGNVRELENEIQRLLLQAEPGALLTPELLSAGIRRVEGVVGAAGVTKGTLREMVEQVERHLVAESLREHGGNKTSAARALGITREGLHKKLRQLGMS
ncbi:MAG: sigma 54-interacting transcriptional regulator [Polyangiaceae bacterium]|nr:sigma 54-interacting transcriptional regulator [Polyangiaceae bacterium]